MLAATRRAIATPHPLSRGVRVVPTLNEAPRTLADVQPGVPCIEESRDPFRYGVGCQPDDGKLQAKSVRAESEIAVANVTRDRFAHGHRLDRKSAVPACENLVDD